LKFDLHVHTEISKDAFTKVSDLARVTRRRGLDGIAITDHNSLCSNSPDGTATLPGIEISSADGHVIGLGLSDAVSRGLSADETIMAIHRKGGLAIIPHPYDLFRSSVGPERLTVRPDAIEVFNASSFLHSITWKKAFESARRAGLPMVAGSDSHIPQTIGSAYTIVESASLDPNVVMSAIRNGSVTPIPGTVNISHRVRKLLLRSTDHR
jgi:predicted metal-dependent phosphoesterase TrpH